MDGRMDGRVSGGLGEEWTDSPTGGCRQKTDRHREGYMEGLLATPPLFLPRPLHQRLSQTLPRRSGCFRRLRASNSPKQSPGGELPTFGRPVGAAEARASRSQGGSAPVSSERPAEARGDRGAPSQAGRLPAQPRRLWSHEGRLLSPHQPPVFTRALGLCG